MKLILVVVAATSLVACGGGAVLNPSNSNIPAETEFCGVSIKFTDKPKLMSKSELDTLRESFGKFLKYEITAMWSDNYHLTEVAICQCLDISESYGMVTKTTPASDATDINKDVISGIGPSTTWIHTQSQRKLYFRVVDLYPRNRCELLQFAVTPINNTSYPSFLKSVSEIKSKIAVGINSSPKERLIQLEALKRDGLINQSDYDAKKKSIIDSF